MSQNVYDRADFFEQYIKLERQKKGLDGPPEWPGSKTSSLLLMAKHFSISDVALVGTVAGLCLKELYLRKA